MSKQTPVVIVHGFFARPFFNLPLHWFLSGEGLSSYDVPISGLNTQDIRESSQAVANRVDEIREKEVTDEVNLLGVSLGGLIGLHYIRREGGHEDVNRFVSLAAPLHGTSNVPAPELLSGVFGRAPEQMLPESQFMEELHREPYPTTDILTLCVEGDPMVKPESASLKEAENIVTDHGKGSLAHHMSILHPKNYEIYRDALLES